MGNRLSLAEIHGRTSGKLSDKWDLYLQIYEQLLSGYRDKDLNLLEIGVQNGGSLETWGIYFGRAKNIIGCDIDAKCGDLRFDDQRIHVVIGDATDPNTASSIDAIASSFDIIIEDGSHTSRDIVASFNQYFPRLREGGVYIAEDLHCCYWDELGGGLCNPYSGIEYFKALCDCLNSNHWYRQDVAQVDYINSIADFYGSPITDELLRSILSIEFYDSVCVIRKAEPGRLSRLRQRLIGGAEERVASGHQELGRLMPIVQQKESKLTGIVSLVNEIALLSGEKLALSSEKEKISAENSELIASLADLKSSMSWRITKPLRAMKRMAKLLVRSARSGFNSSELH